MKVAIINQHINDTIGGSEMQCDLIAKGLTQLGHEVYYLVVQSKPNYHSYRYSNLTYKTIPIDIKNKKDIKNILSSLKPDILYWRYNKHFLFNTVKICYILKIPFVFAISHCNDTLIIPTLKDFKVIINQSKDIFRAFIKIIKRFKYHIFTIPACRYISALTTLNSDYLGRLPIKKQTVIWNAVSKEVGEFNWPKPFCMWVANIKRQKRPELFIELARIFSDIMPEIDFLMFGSIQCNSYIEVINSAAELKNFHYLGKKSPDIINKALSIAECMVHTCYTEGFGNNFIQAWLMKCPVISYEFDPDNLIKTRKMGLLSGSIEQMVADAKLLLHNKKLKNEIINNSYIFASANFIPDVMCKKLESFLIDVVQI